MAEKGPETVREPRDHRMKKVFLDVRWKKGLLLLIDGVGSSGGGRRSMMISLYTGKFVEMPDNPSMHRDGDTAAHQSSFQ
jgi:hypothetical protein